MIRLLKRALLALVALALLGVVARAAFLTERVHLDLVLADPTLEFAVHLAPLPDGSDRLALVQKTGQVRWFVPAEGRIGGTIIDLNQKIFHQGWEDGLLSIAFDPRFAENHAFYLFYSMKDPLRSVIARFRLDPETLTADPASEEILLETVKPSLGHNGGQLAFGPDGYLYAGIGDGQGQDHTIVQKRTTLLGTIIRIDVSGTDGQRPYRIPTDNPFATVDDGTPPEIWAYGFRNPWRFSIDPVSGRLIAGDVGDRAREELDLVEKGRNYGWAIMEGDLCYQSKRPPCDATGLTPPIGVFPRWVFRTIVGGHIYRGDDVPWLTGQYVFADYFRGLYTIPLDHDGIVRLPTLLNYRPRTQQIKKGASIHLSSFGEDTRGRLYVLSLRGEVYRMIEPSLGDKLADFARLAAFQ